MKLVLDASVAVKWFFRSRPEEDDTAAALSILRNVADGEIDLIEPPHFLAEVCAVLARESPATAKASVASLLEVDMLIAGTDALLLRATDLAVLLDQHLFDTLYHAAAIEHGATLVTADERYWRKAKREGSIARLCDFEAAG